MLFPSQDDKPGLVEFCRRHQVEDVTRFDVWGNDLLTALHGKLVPASLGDPFTVSPLGGRGLTP